MSETPIVPSEQERMAEAALDDVCPFCDEKPCAQLDECSSYAALCHHNQRAAAIARHTRAEVNGKLLTAQELAQEVERLRAEVLALTTSECEWCAFIRTCNKPSDILASHDAAVQVEALRKAVSAMSEQKVYGGNALSHHFNRGLMAAQDICLGMAAEVEKGEGK